MSIRDEQGQVVPRVSVGRGRGQGPMWRATYIGPRVGWAGRTALVRQDAARAARVVVQLDDVSTGFGYGWWSFRADHWEERVDEDIVARLVEREIALQSKAYRDLLESRNGQ